ncbi:MAG TPA: T9SS type A sorting domain-containing protein [Bacteroidetes bacterium]|nr:T9SS type A sorting domain-containing protein [Bacteroidota bacterium]
MCAVAHKPSKFIAFEKALTKKNRIKSNIKGEVWKNPTNDRVYIKGISSGTGSVSVALHDLSGRQVLLQDFNAAAFELDLSGINEGIYFLELKGGDGSLHLIKKIAIVR